MASDFKPYEPLRTMCDFALDEMDKSGGDEDKAWLLGFRALTDMNYEFAAEPVTVCLPVPGNKIIPFPPDALSINKAGIVNTQGELVSLKKNNALTSWRDGSPDRVSQVGAVADVNNSVQALSGNPWFANFYYNGAYYNLFGVGGGLITNGDYNIDEKNRLIILNLDFAYDNIFVEMISAPEKNNDYAVPTTLREAIIAFIKWKMGRGTADEYYGECIKARRRTGSKKVVLATINQVLRESESFKLRS